jgi:transcriptional regulator with XRE-family HTH domain
VTDALGAAAERVRDLASRLGQDPAERLDTDRLHHISGVPADVIRALLSGDSAGEPDIQKRFEQRLKFLQAARLKDDGRKFSQVEIAQHTKISRQQINALFLGERRPTMDHCSRIERFFERPAGFLQAEDVDALLAALQVVEKELLEEYAHQESEPGPAPSIYERHGVDGIALRAALLPTDQDRRKVTEFIDDLLTELKASPPREK